MVGGGPETKAIFHVTRGPASACRRSSTTSRDAVGMFVNEQTAAFAMTGTRALPARRDRRQQGAAPRRARPAHPRQRPSGLQRQLVRHPGHLSQRLAGPLHPHEPRRAGEHRLDEARPRRVHRRRQRLRARDASAPRTRPRCCEMMEPFALERRARGDAPQGRVAVRRVVRARDARARIDRFLRGVHVTAPRKVKGTMSAFGYDYFTRTTKARDPPERRVSLRGAEPVDGKRTDAEIRDLLSAIYEPVPLEDVSSISTRWRRSTRRFARLQVPLHQRRVLVHRPDLNPVRAREHQDRQRGQRVVQPDAASSPAPRRRR